MVNTQPPAVSGEPRVGETLTADPGSWEPSPEETAFQWLRDGESISGATGATYLLADADEGHLIAVAVTASATDHEAATEVSEAVGPIAAKPPVRYCNGKVATIVGTPGPDRIRGTHGTDVIVARGGDDVIHALGGNDVVCAGAGDDVVHGGSGADSIRGGWGDDTLLGNRGPDLIVGRAGSDLLEGGRGPDRLRGNRGHDVLKGGPGRDTLNGHRGRDTLYGGWRGDRLVGGRGNDRLNGGPGHDVLEGRKQDDVLDGGDGRDRLRGGPGRDVLRGHPVRYPRRAPDPAWTGRNARAVGAGANPRVGRIPDRLWQSMTGLSWRRGCPVGRPQLRAVRVNYWDFRGDRRRGALIVHRDIAWRAARALRDMYRKGYPIRRMHPVDRFGWSSRLQGANDYASMRADNTSGFNCRSVVGRPGVRSPHSWGRAVDINPWENPYYSAQDGWVPNRWWVGRSHPRVAWRSAQHPVMRIWRSHGFRWTYGTSDSHHVDGRRPPGYLGGSFVAE